MLWNMVPRTLPDVLQDVGVAIPITLAVAALWLLALQRIVPFYRDKRLPHHLASFFGAGFLSIPLVFAFSATIAPMGTTIPTAIGSVWNMIVVVGIVEELSKWLIFAVLMQYLRPLRSPEDGIIFAAAVGLAFATVENVVYAGRYGTSILWFRSFSGTIGHMTYGALWGFVWSSVTWDTGGAISRQQLPLAASAITAVAVLHGLYNASLYLGIVVGIGIKFIILLLSIHAYQYLIAHSPYRHYPFRRARRAVPALRTALRHNPRSIILRRRLGMHYLRLRDYAAAEQQFRRALLQQGGRSGVLTFLIELAVYAQNRTEEGTRRLRMMYAAMPAGIRRALRRHLPDALAEDPVLSSILRGLMEMPRRWTVPYRAADPIR